MNEWPVKQWKKVAIQGAAGSYSHMAAGQICPQAEVMFNATFEAALEAVGSGGAEGAVIPVENSTMGRIPDIHHIMPRTDLRILGEHYLAVRHCLLGVKGAKLQDVKRALSQPPALEQCRRRLVEMGIAAVAAADTAGAARMVAEAGDKAQAAVASRLAAEVYGLEVLDGNLNDEGHNTTRFICLGREQWQPPLEVPCVTTLIFRLRDVPGALFKALGGFATNGVNLTKLESYILGGSFRVAQFYADCRGHVESAAMRQSLEELGFFSESVKILGCYPAAGEEK
ncbi:MAG: prephenate dehydratase [Proteobacteria bacterium]|nr:prephenate dehydratase [Pseudomonadota bacterium]